jgi:hypothetical protein
VIAPLVLRIKASFVSHGLIVATKKHKSLVPFCGSLLADDVGGHHAAARTDVRQFRK